MSTPGRRAAAVLAAGTLLFAACGSDDETGSPQESQAAGDGAESFNDADVLFAQGMIPHHSQAIEMANLALAPSARASDEITELATAIRDAQEPEIEQMSTWLREWDQPSEMPGMAEADHDADHMAEMDGMMSDDQMTALETLSGSAFDTQWAETMIAHHEGAISMAETVKADGSDPGVATLADQIIAAQEAEIEQMQAMLAR